MTHRGQITDRMHRVCIECGERRHINQIRTGSICPECGATRWTRDKSNVKA